MRSIRSTRKCGALLALVGALATAETLAAGNYGLAIDFEHSQGGPFPLSQHKFLDPSVIDSLCRDGDGCTISLKVDGSGGVQATTEWIFLSAFSPTYTTTTTLNEPPFVDGDGLDRYLAVVQFKIMGPQFSQIACGLTDEDDNP